MELARREYDLLVIGGGIYGVCAAWDAALRGLSVALVEKGDLGHGTSSNSLRVIHGGLRYLQHGDLRRLRQSIQERKIFMRIAPHLVHPLPFFIPTYGHAMRGKELLKLALLINDIVGFDRNSLKVSDKYLPPGRVISREECLRMFPGIDATNLTGGGIVYDCQMFSSERLILSFAHSASRVGAQIANYLEVCGILSEGGRLSGVRARDVLGGNEIEIRARTVVNSSGPWSERVLGLWDGRSPKAKVRLSKAFNILVDRQLVQRYGVGIYTKSSFKDEDALLSKGSRLLFMTPWHNQTLIGTVHLPYDCDPDQCRVTENEIQAFIEEINEAYPAAALKRQDVCFTYGGLLPMANHGKGGVQLLKRYRILDHATEDGIAGLVSVMGVKLTEARHVAEKTIDLIFAKLGYTSPKSRTANTPLYGGDIPVFSAFLSQEVQRIPQQGSTDAFRRLIHLYGSAYPEVLKYLENTTKPNACHSSDSYSLSCRERQRSAEASHVNSSSHACNSSLTAAEVRYSVREEMAQKLTDVVFRRTSLGLAGNRGDVALDASAAIMSRELGWDDLRSRREVDEVKMVFSGSCQAT